MTTRECHSPPLARCTSLRGEKKSTPNMIENAESLLSEIAENSRTSNQTEAVRLTRLKRVCRLEVLRISQKEFRHACGKNLQKIDKAGS